MKLKSLPKELEPLAKRFDRDEPRVLVVVGAGVSKGATSAPHASWRDLLKHGVNYLVEKDVFTHTHGAKLCTKLDAAFQPFNLTEVLEYAETIQKNLALRDHTAFKDWLESAFDDFVALKDRSETLEAIRDLQQAGALLLTTNYDSLLTDATGLPPVTWKEHEKFLSVINRQSSGILHIHGHWKHPESVVLGSSSYDKIVQEEYIQAAFQSLWMQMDWLYVGCGDGLDDPNLGRLLKWGKKWGISAPKHYFLAQTKTATALANRPDKPANLISVGFTDYSELPDILRLIPPTARPWPFTPIDVDFPLFRSPDLNARNVPFPTYQEYCNGDVPAFAADIEVNNRLRQHGWVFVLDLASVGKTTLLLRLATSKERKDHLAFYLDLATVEAEEVDTNIAASLQRLTRPNTLLILDNVHHQPELARQLWEQWRNRPNDSHLLLAATRMQRNVITSPAQELTFFEHHATNPSLEVRPTAYDLGQILQHLYSWFSNSKDGIQLNPPLDVLQTWHLVYGHTLGAFCLAVLGRLAALRRGNWELPLNAASAWVQEKWLRGLNGENLENLLCLAVFGAQEFEMLVPNEALPHPGQTSQLLRLGLANKAEHGRWGEYQSLALRDPKWGLLIIESQSQAIDKENILLAAASKNSFAALVLGGRFYRARMFDRLNNLWAFIADRPHSIVEHACDLPLSHFSGLVNATQAAQQIQLTSQLWKALEQEPAILAQRAWETPLNFVGSFLETAKRHGRDMDPLWLALEQEPACLAQRAWESNLGELGSFLETAKRHGRDVDPLWLALEQEPAILAQRAWETPLNFVGSFLETAKRHGRDMDPLWLALEQEPACLAQRAWESNLGELGSFLETAKRHGRDVDPLWLALEQEPAILAQRAWETPLDHVGSFLETAKRHGRDMDPLWRALEQEPACLAQRAWETPLDHVGSFLETTKRHGRDVEPLWRALEQEPEKLAQRAWETPLDHVGSFLETAKRHGRDVDPLWLALEQEPTKLSAMAQQISVSNLVGFCRHAPNSVVKNALTQFHPEYWENTAEAKQLNGIVPLAIRCAEVGRDDLKDGIIKTMLRRANTNDFSPFTNGMVNVALLLANVPSDAASLALTFLDAICKTRWLDWQYKRALCGSLAGD